MEAEVLIDNILERIDEGGPRSYYSFETFIVHLLKYHIEKQSKKFLIKIEPTYAGDGLAPQGFDDFLGPTLVEIKFNLATQPINLLIAKLCAHISSMINEVALSDLIIISAKSVPEKIREKILTRFEQESVPFKVHIWGPEEMVIPPKNKRI